MGSGFRGYLGAGIALAGAGLNMVAPVSTDALVRPVLLTGADSPLGGGTALMIGASGIPTPSQGWLRAFDALYLQPRDFTGTMQPVTTPESLYPFTLPFSETFDRSVAQGAQNVVNAVQQQIAAGGVDAANPIVITGWSQGSTVDSLVMSQLAAHGVPSDDLHLVIVGDPNAPNGGMLERFDVPAGTNPDATFLGMTFGAPTPSDLYPADVYNMEYDGFADFPQYPINFLADINAYLGIVFNHIAYEGLTAQQVNDAVLLPGSQSLGADTLTNYYMIPSASLPLLDPLRLVPFVGNPLADLLQPDLAVLVNLGYGSTTDGWSTGAADVLTPMGFLPPSSVLDRVPQALADGLSQGLADAGRDLVTPGNYQLIAPETMTDVLGPLVGTVTAAGDLNDPSDFATWISAELDGIGNWFAQGVGEVSLSHTGVPPIDMAATLLLTLPQIAVNLYDSQLAAGDPVDAVGDPIAALVGLSPLMLIGALI